MNCTELKSEVAWIGMEYKGEELGLSALWNEYDPMYVTHILELIPTFCQRSHSKYLDLNVEDAYEISI